MSESLAADGAPTETAAIVERRPSLISRYAAALSFVAVATGCGFILEPLMGAANLTLVFVLPVMASAFGFGWGPSLAATLASVLAFDFFFTEPRYSLAIARPADAWAAGLLLVIATAVCAVAAESRRRERAALWAADQAQALQALAHLVVRQAPEGEVVAAAATALSRIFRAPAVVFLQRAGVFRAVAVAGGAQITPAEQEAAEGARDSDMATRAEAYPFHRSTYDFWPVDAPGGRPCVVGVSFLHAGRPRPEAPERFIEIVAASLVAALERD